MQGYPKNLQTREDFEYVLAHFSKEQYRPDFQALLDGRFEYRFDHIMEDDEVIPEGIVYKIFQQPGKDGMERAVYYRHELPDAQIYQLGYTVEEVESIIK